MNEKQTVFVSCGQRTETERTLGRSICDLVTRITPFGSYFAENQSSTGALTTNIFDALNRARGLIAVMHRRGHIVFDPLTEGPSQARASVFIEQEVALHAFLTQSLKRDLLAAAFVQRGIAREGVREHIILNPVEFETDDEVLDRLAIILPSWTETPLPRSPLVLRFRVLGAGQLPGVEGPQKRLKIRLENTGARTVKQWKVEVEIPAGIREPTAEDRRLVPGRGTSLVDLFRVTESTVARAPLEIQGGDTHDVFDYFYAWGRLQRALGVIARVRLWVDDDLVATETVSLKDERP